MIELLANRLGSIITAISVSTGAVAAEYDYQAYGARTETVPLDQPYGFTGREHDSETGLIHLRARAYDPEAGLFLQVDPAEFETGTHNFFAYVGGDPLNQTDPDGLKRRKKRPPVGGMSQIERFILEEGEAYFRDVAIRAVAEGVFGLTGFIVGALAYHDAQIDAVLQNNTVGGDPHKHHCYPAYQSGSRKIGPLATLNANKHKFGHKAMQEYLRVYNLRWTTSRAGAAIRGSINQAYMRRVSRNFYDDMFNIFKLDLKC